MSPTKTHLVIWVSFICIIASAVLLMLPWATIPSGDDLSGTTRVAYRIFQLPALKDASLTSGVIADVSALASRSPLLIAGACAIILCLALFAVLTARRSKKAALPGFLGFAGTIAVPMLFMNLVYDANAESAYAGPGLFASKYISIAPPVFILLFLGIFSIVVAVPSVSDIIRSRFNAIEPVDSKGKSLAPAKERIRNFINNFIPSFKRDRYLYLMLAPFLAYYVIFYYLPYGGLQIAFMDYKPLLGIAGSKFVGMKNFIEFFTGPYFWRILRNTLLLNIYDLLWGFPIPILLAILFNELKNKHFRTLAQSISYIPNFISTVVIAGMVINFLSPSYGVINFILLRLRLIEEPIYFIAKNAFFRTIYVTQNIWAWSGFSSIIYYSSICAIDAELYEAAKIDGASRFRQITRIMLPCLLPTIAIMLIMAVGNLMNSATETIILLYRPVTYEVADVIGSYVYRLGVTQSNPTYSTATAVGLFNGIIALILVTSANKISKKIGEVSIF